MVPHISYTKNNLKILGPTWAPHVIHAPSSCPTPHLPSLRCSERGGSGPQVEWRTVDNGREVACGSRRETREEEWRPELHDLAPPPPRAADSSCCVAALIFTSWRWQRRVRSRGTRTAWRRRGPGLELEAAAAASAGSPTLTPSIRPSAARSWFVHSPLPLPPVAIPPHPSLPLWSPRRSASVATGERFVDCERR